MSVMDHRNLSRVLARWALRADETRAKTPFPQCRPGMPGKINPSDAGLIIRASDPQSITGRYTWSQHRGKVASGHFEHNLRDPYFTVPKSGCTLSDKCTSALCNHNIKSVKSELDISHPHARREASDSPLPSNSYSTGASISPFVQVDEEHSDTV